MAITETTYYGLTRVREQSPEAKDWASVDRNPELISLLLKAYEQHAHTGAKGINYPGFNVGTVTNYITNPVLGIDSVGWSGSSSNLSGEASSRIADSGSPSGWAFQVTGTASTASPVVNGLWTTSANRVVAVSGDVITVRMSVKLAAFTGTSATATLKATSYTSGGAQIGSALALQGPTAITVADGWVQLSGTFVAPSTTASVGMFIEVAGSGASGTVTVRFVKAQVLKNVRMIPGYFDGTSENCSWTGTAHASTSTLNNVDSGNPTLPTLTELTTGGVLTPGTTVGVRLAYKDSAGLETDASSEVVHTLSPAASRPLAPVFVSQQIATNALPGGTYIYAMTKRKGSGETVISDVLPVTIPYDNTYSVSLSFDAISSYTDGTTSLNIYRSTGLNSAFQLLTTVTTAGQTTFTDTNTIAPENTNVQPPLNNTFDANKKIRIDWSNIIHPTNANYLRVYVTNQAGLWSVDHLLAEIDITTNSAVYIDYLGSETLTAGWPLNTTQIPSKPPKLNLGTEAVGGFNLTADSDFNGFKAVEMVLGNTSLSTNGAVWYDTTSHKFKGFANGLQVDLSPPSIQTNYVKNPSFETDAATWLSLGAGLTITSISDVTAKAGVKIGRQSGNLTNGSTANLSAFDNTNSTTIVATTAPARQSDNAYARVWVRSSASLGATGKIELRIEGVASNFTGAGGVAVATITNPTAGTWYELTGALALTALASDLIAVYLQVKTTNNSGATITGLNIDVDGALLTKVATTSTVIPYFDGTSTDAAWTGTAHASFSVLGKFQHATEEAGGHKAENITFGPTNVKTVLSRIASTTTGEPNQVQQIGQSNATTSNPTITSTSYTQIAEMTAQVTTTYDNQWVEVFVNMEAYLTLAQISGVYVSGTLNLILSKNASDQTSTERTFTININDSHQILSPVYHIQCSVAGTQTFALKGSVNSGTTATFVSTRRKLTAKLVF